MQLYELVFRWARAMNKECEKKNEKKPKRNAINYRTSYTARAQSKNSGLNARSYPFLFYSHRQWKQGFTSGRVRSESAFGQERKPA
jgi:hypothetical protein